MNTTEVKIIEQLLETIKEKDATIKELKSEIERLKISLPTIQPNIWENPFRWTHPYSTPYTTRITSTGGDYTYCGGGAKIVFEHKNEIK